MDLKGLKVTVVGIGRSGLAAALLLRNKGARVYATDNSVNEEIKNNAEILKHQHIDIEIGKHSESFVKGKDLMVVSPGVDSRSPVINWAKEYGLPIISELELGYLFCRGRIIAVTGTNGKTTTSALIGNIIKHSGMPVVVCGNIGTPFCSQISNITPGHYVILEVSSFQLEWINRFKPYVSIILNITDDHLDRHKDFNEYVTLKKKIFMNQEKEDFLILNYEDPNSRELTGPVLPKTIFFSRNDVKNICPVDCIRLKGMHNLDNVMASILACRLIGIDNNDIIKGVSTFSALPHRFQSIAEIEGVEFIDDSKATNVDATVKALLSLDRPVILIAGGRDKEGNFSIARDVIRQKISALILIGEAKEKIRDSLKGTTSIYEAASLREAVEQANRIAQKGDAILLSPMCASFDMFKDYAERGEVFVNAVKDLEKSKIQILPR